MSLDPEKTRFTAEYWKQIVTVQMHFNDLCIRTRWLLLTVVSTIIGASFIILKENNLIFKLNIFSHDIILHISVILVSMSIGVCFVLRWLDKKYYYKMLLASVDYSERFEKDNTIFISVIGENESLTNYISQRISRKDSKFAVKIFYNSIIITLISIMISMLIILNS